MPRLTLKKLAEIIGKGFQEVDGGFGELRAEMTGGFASIRAVLQEHSEALADHSVRLDRIEREPDDTISRR